METAQPPAHASLILDCHNKERSKQSPSTAGEDQADAKPVLGVECAIRPSVAELGIYVTGVKTSVRTGLQSKAVGHLMRSKDVRTSDGGVCRGNAVIDSPLLVLGPWAFGTSVDVDLL